jgi:hypothetical protein
MSLKKQRMNNDSSSIDDFLSEPEEEISSEEINLYRPHSDNGDTSDSKNNDSIENDGDTSDDKSNNNRSTDEEDQFSNEAFN